MEIRFAKKSDRENLKNLFAALADWHHELDPAYYRPAVEYAEAQEQEIERALSDKDSAIIVAEENSGLAGFLLADIREAEPYMKAAGLPRQSGAAAGGKIGFVESVFVLPAYRRRGLLTALFKKAETWFEKKGMVGLELNIHCRNQAAIAAWKKLGFEEYKIRMRRV